jgi:diguanylate cyclase (GGDEF)-like protein
MNAYGEGAEQDDKLKRRVEVKLRNIFIGCLVLLVFIVLHLSYFARGPAGWSTARFTLLPTLLWALVVTTYAFHSLWRLARERRERIEELTEHDSATDTYSYAFIGDKVNELAQQASSLEPACAFGYIKISGIEQVNDRFGHAVGNVVLREVAHRIMDTVPDDALTGRLAGQEFCVLVPGNSGAQTEPLMQQVAQKIRQYEVDLGQRGDIKDLGAVFGISTLPNEGQDVDALVRAARSDAMDRVARKTNA